AGRVASRARVAEQATVYSAESAESGRLQLPDASDPEPVIPPGMTDELMALRRQMNQSKALLASGRHAPGLRLLRRTVGALARRRAWTDASISALTLAAEVMKRGQSRDTMRALTDAGQYARRSNDAGSLLDAALLTGHAWIDATRLDEAERVLTAAITSA